MVVVTDTINAAGLARLEELLKSAAPTGRGGNPPLAWP
jgi:hypothetical protein